MIAALYRRSQPTGRILRHFFDRWLNCSHRFLRVTINPDNSSNRPGRLLALDLGAKRVGVAVCDELRITVTPLPLIERRSWKDLLRRVAEIVEGYDARGLIIGLPLNMDGTEGFAAEEVMSVAENFRRSLNVPVYLQDERLTSIEARSEMRAASEKDKGLAGRIDSESAAIILRDFLATSQNREPSPLPLGEVG
jgi:putative Holliday junction resolvase